MKKVIIAGFVIMAIVVMGTGCSKELTIKNPNAVTTINYWTTGDDALKGVNAVYSTLHRGSISRWMLFYYIIRSDEGRSESPATDIDNNMDLFIVTDYNYGNAYGVWNDNYIGINRANQVLDHVPSITMDATLKERYLGEARFMRALFYFHLATLFGNVPMLLHESQLSDQPGTSPVDTIWAQIERDLNMASSELPPSYGSADLGRATKGAAQALLARAYMQQRNYSKALPPLQWLIEGEGKNIYDLMPSFRDNFLVTTENNKESVFEWQFETNSTETGDDDAANTNQNYGQSIAQFFAPPGVGWSDGEACRWPVWEFLKEKTLDGNRDPRLDASLLYDSTDVRGPAFTMIYGQTFSQRYGNSNKKRVWFRKFLNDAWKNDEGYRSKNNYRNIRYADVLLMYAECLNQTGNTAAAYAYVDRVRHRAGLANLSDIKPGMTKDQFLAQLKHERVTELVGEGNRWNDLARWGDLGPQLAVRDSAFHNFVVGKNELLPIPTQEIDINPGLKQNPNW
jgi:starch-binding outer membrane protein, SusD/RagB family